MFKRIALIFLSILFIVGCQPRITEGKIYDKRHKPAWTEHGVECAMRNFDDFSCQFYKPYTRRHPPQWHICIWHQAEGDSDKRRERCVKVSEGIYNEYKEGIYVTVEELR